MIAKDKLTTGATVYDHDGLRCTVAASFTNARGVRVYVMEMFFDGHGIYRYDGYEEPFVLARFHETKPTNTPAFTVRRVGGDK